MIAIDDLVEISTDLWELPKSVYSRMRVPARVYIGREMLEAILADRSIEQLANVATLPGILRYSLAMPDIHQGYGFPVGGVAAIRTDTGVISPGGIGYDINCGVRLLTSQLTFPDAAPALENLATELQRDVPSGVGRGGSFEIGEQELDKILNHGLSWALKRGYASDSDLEATEEHGSYYAADAAAISKEAKERGANQLGTIGAGNHFLEVQRVAQIFEPTIAQDFGLFADQICVMIHTGSRGLGHQTCTDYVRLMNQCSKKYNIFLPDRELACAPFRSAEGQQYFGAMAAAANFAWCNRQLITFQVRAVFKRVLGTADLGLLYDVSHNIAKVEKYDGLECVVHRKGATRAFGPKLKELPLRFQVTGQPVLIPGSMGTSSYVLSGTARAMSDSFGSCCHGAGRAMSRMRAKKTIDYSALIQSLSEHGVIVRGGSAKGLLEEAPQAYKDIDSVIKVVAESGIARPVAKLVPIAVIKG